MSGEIHKNTLVDFKSFMLAQKASQVGAKKTYNNSLKNLQVFVNPKEENTESELAKKSKASVFLNN